MSLSPKVESTTFSVCHRDPAEYWQFSTAILVTFGCEALATTLVKPKTNVNVSKTAIIAKYFLFFIIYLLLAFDFEL
jgi:uncharacterized membrane protein YccF (DUF307 family)